MPEAPRSDLASLSQRVLSSGFTPSVRDLAGLLELLAEDDETLQAAVGRALLRLGPPLLVAHGATLAEASASARPHVCRVVGRLARAEPQAAFDWLKLRLADPDARTRRAAAVAMGKIALPEVEAALLDAWKRETSLPERRALAEALGKVGKGAALEALATVGADDDPELARLAGRSKLMIARTEGRSTPSSIDATRAGAEAVEVAFTCRLGLESILADELGPAFAARPSGPGEVRGTLRGPLDTAFSARTALDFGVLLPVEPIAPGEASEEALVRALTAPRTRALLSGWTRGAVRYRLAWSEGGHRRALVWRVAQRVAEIAPELVNDPTESSWEVRVRDRGNGLELTLVPKGLADPRFTYRVKDVPAASHPTVAAALARVGGVRSGDVVWDPFVGSGTELIERARLGPCRELVGSDLNPPALDVARANLAAAHVTARLVRRDALLGFPALVGSPAEDEEARDEEDDEDDDEDEETGEDSPASRGPTLIVTNPPLGHRLLRAGGAADLLERFVEIAARDLVPGGRLVWITPSPERTARRARAAGLTRRLEQTVDLAGPRRRGGASQGGLRAALEVWEKGSRRPAPFRAS